MKRTNESSDARLAAAERRSEQQHQKLLEKMRQQNQQAFEDELRNVEKLGPVLYTWRTLKND